MEIKAKRFSLIFVVLILGMMAATAFIQFSHVSASGIVSPNAAKPKAAPAENNISNDVGYWVVSVNISDASLNIIHTTDDMVYGPFLEGQLGRGGSLLDVVILPDRETALVSNFGDAAVHFVDLSNPISPSWIISVSVPMFAEDIDLTQDGRFALVTDGAFASEVAVIDTIAMTDVFTLDLGTRQAQAVEIASNHTAVLADYWNGEIHTLLVDDTGEITYTNSYSHLIPSPSGDITIPTPGGPMTYYLGWPVNIGISPDGQTAIVCDAFTTTMSVYQILSPGVLSHTGYVTGLQGSFQPISPYNNGPGVQSIAFNGAGDKAYASINSRYNISGTNFGDQIAILNIDGPGQVSLDIAEAVTLSRYTSGQFFGVDTIVFADEKAYLGYPTSATTGTNDLAVVDLITFTPYTLTVGSKAGDYPTGVAVIPAHEVYLPFLTR